MMFIIDVESSTSPASSWILEKEGVSTNSFVFLLENIKEEEAKICFYQNMLVKTTISIKAERPTVNIALIPICRTRFSKEDQTLTICVPRMSTRHI